MISSNWWFVMLYKMFYVQIHSLSSTFNINSHWMKCIWVHQCRRMLNVYKKNGTHSYSIKKKRFRFATYRQRCGKRRARIDNTGIRNTNITQIVSLCIRKMDVLEGILKTFPIENDQCAVKIYIAWTSISLYPQHTNHHT